MPPRRTKLNGHPNKFSDLVRAERQSVQENVACRRLRNGRGDGRWDPRIRSETAGICCRGHESHCRARLQRRDRCDDLQSRRFFARSDRTLFSGQGCVTAACSGRGSQGFRARHTGGRAGAGGDPLDRLHAVVSASSARRCSRRNGFWSGLRLPARRVGPRSSPRSIESSIGLIVADCLS